MPRYPWLKAVVVASLVVLTIIGVGNLARTQPHDPQPAVRVHRHLPSCTEDEILHRPQVPGPWVCMNTEEFVIHELSTKPDVYDF